jgi:hypothetical protein
MALFSVNSSKSGPNVTKLDKSANFIGCAQFGIDMAHYHLYKNLPCLSRAGVDISADLPVVHEFTDAGKVWAPVTSLLARRRADSRHLTYLLSFQQCTD